ncbi:MAG: hypothetical protein SGI74_07660 [Oligoflexia bacterium]|nr:hypothetical protein [Oligoflexia bacterium]
MAADWQNKVKEWKKTFPWYKRLLYFVGGWPPMHQITSEHTWKQWSGRYDKPEYDWKNHSGTKK